MCEDFDEFGKEKLFFRNFFKIRDFELIINFFLVVDFLFNDKCGILKEFLLNKMVLIEVVDVFNMYFVVFFLWFWIFEGLFIDVIVVEMWR